MQVPPTPGRSIRPVVLAVCGLLLAIVASVLAWWMLDRAGNRQSPRQRTQLGAHALVGQLDTRADAIARTPGLDTARRGSSFLVFAGGFASNDAIPTDTYGNRWSLLKPPEVYRGYDGRFDLRAYLVLDAKGGPGDVVEMAKPGEPKGELTLVMVEARNAGRLVDVARTYPEPGFRLTSGTVTTDGPALLVASWWGDGGHTRHYAQPGDGFQVIQRFTKLPDSAVQAVVAVREVETAGTYRVHWYNAPRQGAILWLLAFAPEDKTRPAKARAPAPE